MLSFSEFVEERDRCRDPTYESPYQVLRDGFFCNTNRMWDRVSRELEAATGHPWLRYESILTILALRMAGFPREGERPGAGARPIMAAALDGLDQFRAYVRTMPFSGRKTYRAVMRKSVLAGAIPCVAWHLSRRRRARSLASLQQRVIGLFGEFQDKLSEFSIFLDC